MNAKSNLTVEQECKLAEMLVNAYHNQMIEEDERALNRALTPDEEEELRMNWQFD